MSLKILLMFIMIVSMAAGTHSNPPAEKPTGTEFPQEDLTWQKALMLVENEKSSAEDKAQTESTAPNRTTEPGSDPQTGHNEPSAGSRTSPLKDFKPSEEIAAEQAVDFPVDI